MKAIGLVTLLFAGMFFQSAQGQQQTTKAVFKNKVGDLYPNYTFNDVINFPAKKTSIADFRGKWLILDLWSKNCSGCIASFPRMDSLSRKFKDKVQVIMVGANGSVARNNEDSLIKGLYKHLARKWPLTFTVAFDSTFFGLNEVVFVPLIFVIDPQGIVRAKTTHVDEGQLVQLLEGKQVIFEKAFSGNEKFANSEYSSNLPLLTNGGNANGGVDTSFLFRSVLTEQTDLMNFANAVDIIHPYPYLYKNNIKIRSGLLELFGRSVSDLYRFAFFGLTVLGTSEHLHFASAPILEISDTAKYNGFNKKTYAYSLKIPASRYSPAYLMQCMQSDLQKYFDFKAERVTRNVPVYYLEISDSAKANKLFGPTSGITKIEDTYDSYQFTNVPIVSACETIEALLKLNRVLFNGTGHTNAINLQLIANMVDPKEVMKSLESNGFRVVEGLKEMEVVVIRDK